MNWRKRTPGWVRDQGRRASLVWGERTADRRPLPDFLVIGGQRCGTTSMFRALMDHPHIKRANLHKGVNYYDINYERGERWYRGHFPVRARDDRTQVFDASGYYMFHPLAATRIASDQPEVKIVAMLRNPVERAFSAYKHELARGFEWETTFASALRLEDARLEGEVERMTDDPTYQSFNHRHHAYRARGQYARLLAPYISLLGRERVHVVESERFFAQPEEEYAALLAFLGLDQHDPKSFERYNARPSKDMNPHDRELLTNHFEAHDERLAEVLGRAPVWRS